MFVCRPKSLEMFLDLAVEIYVQGGRLWESLCLSPNHCISTILIVVANLTFSKSHQHCIRYVEKIPIDAAEKAIMRVRRWIDGGAAKFLLGQNIHQLSLLSWWISLKRTVGL